MTRDFPVTKKGNKLIRTNELQTNLVIHI